MHISSNYVLVGVSLQQPGGVVECSSAFSILPTSFCRHHHLFPFSLLYQGKYDEAGQLYERSLAIREKAYGPDHPAVASALNNRAGLLKNQVRAKRWF